MQIAKVFALLLILLISESQSTVQLKWDGFFNLHTMFHSHKQTDQRNHPTSQNGYHPEKPSEYTSGTADTEDSENTQDIEFTQDTKDTKSTKNTEITESTGNTEITESTDNTEVTGDTEDTVVVPIEESPTDMYDQFSPRVLFSHSPPKMVEPPVDVVRIWLRELGLFQLQSQILQAKHMSTKENTILLELRTALQAIQLVEQLSQSPKEGLLKGLSANQTRIDFFNDFPRSEFD